MVLRELITKWGFDVDSSGLSEMEAGVNTMKTSLKALGVAVAGAAAGVTFLLNKAGQEEQTQIAFETMLGSAEKAVKLMKDIKNFADVTPFETDEVVQASKGLLAFGVAQEDIIDKTRTLGNIASGVGKDKFGTLIRGFGKIKTKGKATMEELNMFLEAGVPILDELAVGFGVTKEEIFKLVSTGKVGFNDVDKALQRMTTGNGKFAGLMAKQSKSLLGLWSTILGMADNFTKELGKKLLPTGKKVLAVIIETFNKNRAKAIKVLTVVIQAMVSVLTKTWEVISRLFDAASKVVNLFSTWEDVIGNVLTAMGILIGGGILLGMGQMAIGLFKLIRAFDLLKIKSMLAWAASFAGPLLVGAAIAGLFLIFEDLLAWFNGDKSITGQMFGSFDVATKKISELFNNMWEGLKSGAQAAWDFVALMGRSLLSILMTPVRAFTNGLKLLATGMQALQKGDIGGILDIAKNALSDTFNIDPTRDIGEIIGGGDISKSPSGNGGGSVSQKNDIIVNVPAGLTPEQSADAVRFGTEDALSSLFRKTSRQLSTPIVE